MTLTGPLLAAFPTLTALRAADLDEIRATVARRSPRLASKAAEAAADPAEAATGRVIAELTGQLDRIFARRDALEKEIQAVFLGAPFGENLASLPGIGPRTGARILAEIGDGSGFATGSARPRPAARKARPHSPASAAAPRPAADRNDPYDGNCGYDDSDDE